MKIVIATSVYYPMINGVAMFSRNLVVGLARRGYEVLVLTPSQTGRRHTEISDGVKIKYLSSTAVKVYPDQIHDAGPRKKFLGREMPRVFYKHGFRVSVFPGGQIKRILNSFQPDVVHVQGSDPIGVATVSYARKHQIPVVMTEHNQPEVLTEPLHIPNLIRKPVNGILAAYFLNRESKSDFVTMPTELSIKNLVGDKDLGVKVEAVSNGVDLSFFKPGKPDESIYNIYGVPRGAPIILYIGRVDPEKKVGVVLEAFRDFLDKHKLDELSKTLLLVVGDGVDKNRLMKEADKMGLRESVKFLGRVMPPDLYDIYKLGDVFVTASEIETQGIVLIEAAATGLPLIAVDAGAVAEICHNDENGFLLNPGDAKSMSEAMTKILSDKKLRERMSKKSVELAKEHSLERTIDKFLEIYQKVIKKV